MGYTISGLDALADGSAAAGDLVEVVDVSDTSLSASGTNKKLALSALFTYVRTALQSVSAALGIGTSVTTGASAGEVVLPNAKALRGVNAGGDTALAMIRVDANNIVQLGQPTSGVYTSVGTRAAVDLPVGASNNSGVLLVDTTNNRLIYYSGTSRFYIGGTSF